MPTDRVPGTSLTLSDYKQLPIVDRYYAAQTAYKTARGKGGLFKSSSARKWKEQIRLLEPMARAMQTLEQRQNAESVARSLNVKNPESITSAAARKQRKALAERQGYLSTVFSETDDRALAPALRKKTLLGR